MTKTETTRERLKVPSTANTIDDVVLVDSVFINNVQHAHNGATPPAITFFRGKNLKITQNKYGGQLKIF